MRKHPARSLWIVPMVLALAILACSGSSPEPTATAFLRPTLKPLASATEPPTRPTARPSTTPKPAQPTAAATSTDTTGITLSDTPFAHKSGAFTVNLPAGWTVDERTSDVFATAPDKVSSIDISFTNVGTVFDAATLATYVKAEEDNWFGTFGSYTPNDPQILADGSTLVHKTLVAGGVPQTVFSYYWETGTVVYEQDMWVDTDKYDAYVDGLVSVANSMETNSDAGGTADAYGIVYKFTDPNKLFEFDVPYGYTHNTSAGDSSQVETFTAPDQHSSIENISYDNGTAVAPDAAAAFAVKLLDQHHNITDLKIASSTKQKDGSVLIVWQSTGQGIEGESFYEIRGTTFLLLTWIVNPPDHDFFRPVWKVLYTSYAIPK